MATLQIRPAVAPRPTAVAGARGPARRPARRILARHRLQRPARPSAWRRALGEILPFVVIVPTGVLLTDLYLQDAMLSTAVFLLGSLPFMALFKPADGGQMRY